MKKNKDKCRIRYTDTMTSYLLDYVFDSEEAVSYTHLRAHET